MTDHLIQVAEGFWNIRGSYKVAGIAEVGTQMSLARIADGDFVLLDSYRLAPDLAQAVYALTDGGRAVRAVLNLHPFHTLHVRATAAQFPQARLYGTTRHKAKAPELAWDALHTDEEALHAKFSRDFRFSVPHGVDFISRNQHLHFASVLALHEHSKTLHVDDTLTWSNLPFFGGLKFHPTLRFVLQKRAGAAAAFRDWATELIELCENVDRICTAHGRALPPARAHGFRPSESVRAALARVEGLLKAHARRYR